MICTICRAFRSRAGATLSPVIGSAGGRAGAVHIFLRRATSTDCCASRCSGRTMMGRGGASLRHDGFASLDARASRHAGNAAARPRGGSTGRSAGTRARPVPGGRRAGRLPGRPVRAARRRRRPRRRAGRDAAPGAELRQPARRRMAAAVLPDPLQRDPGPAARVMVCGAGTSGWLPGGARHDDEAGEDPLEQVPDAASRAPAAAGRDEAMQHLDGPCGACRRASSRRSRCAASRASTSRRPRRRWAAARAA